jgi:type IV pilus assembly protein PilA
MRPLREMKFDPRQATRSTSRLVVSAAQEKFEEIGPKHIEAIRPMKSRPSLRKREPGFSLIELLIVVAIILVIAAIAIPNFLRSKIAANEASAVSNVRTITSASVVYSSTYQNGYPPTLDALGGVAPPTCDKADLLDPNLSNPPYQKSGYTFAYTGNIVVTLAPGCTAQGFLAYLATATPIQVDATGTRSFCSSEPGTIHFDGSGVTTGSANACGALPALQ